MTRAKQADSPVSLFEACRQEEERRHSARMNELAGMKASLARLDAYMPMIRAAGLALNLEYIFGGFPSGSLGIRASEFFGNEKQKELVTVLLAAGFKLADQHDYSTWQSVILKKGRLQVRVTGVDMVPAKAAKEAVHP